MPERDIESLARKFFRRRCRRRAPLSGDASWDGLGSRRAERAPPRTGVILDADFKSKLR